MNAIYAVFLMFLFPVLTGAGVLLISYLTGFDQECLMRLAVNDNPIACIDVFGALILGGLSFFVGLFVVPPLCFSYQELLLGRRTKALLIVGALALIWLCLAVSLKFGSSSADAIQIAGPLGLATLGITALIYLPWLVRLLLSRAQGPASVERS